jgi:hypothetical protein
MDKKKYILTLQTSTGNMRLHLERGHDYIMQENISNQDFIKHGFTVRIGQQNTKKLRMFTLA